MPISDDQLRALFDTLDKRELLGLWASLMSELNERGVIRSENNPIGDYCEFLVAAHYEVEPETSSRAGYDVKTPDGERLQVKGRRVGQTGKLPPHYSAIRNLDDDPPPFDFVIALLMKRDFSIREAWKLPVSAVRRHARYRSHINGWQLPVVKGSMLDDPEIERFELRVEPRD
ncbi:MAG: hypothetical protein WD689_02895 [Gaiellaceae bacterium]